MQPATAAILPQLSDAPQAIAFSESEGICSAEVLSKTVIVASDAGKHNHGSSKVKLKNLVDYNWEHRYYTGQLLAVHKGGNYLAYAMKVAKVITKQRNSSANTNIEDKKNRQFADMKSNNNSTQYVIKEANKIKEIQPDTNEHKKEYIVSDHDKGNGCENFVPNDTDKHLNKKEIIDYKVDKNRELATKAFDDRNKSEFVDGTTTDFVEGSEFVNDHCRDIWETDVPNKTNSGAWSGMVRVIHKATDKRVLLKGMKGEIQDLEFAYIDNQVILASIDEHGHTYIHSIELVENELRASLVLEIVNDGSAACTRHRVVWCPYIPDEDDTDVEPEDDNARLLLTTHYNTARIWKMWGIVNGLPDGVHAVTATSILESHNPNLVTVSDHTAAIVDAAFSPDGTALATASVDGYVMFFQVYMHNEKTPRCLHRWQPHEGKPLSCLFFLDNHKNYSSDVQFWKFAVTGAERNEVIKIWCCKSWDCRQTITFAPDVMSELSEPSGLKAVLDAGAEYLLLSDFKRRCLYVLHMKQDTGDNMAYCKGIAEYLLPFPVLSFAVCDAGTRAITCSSQCGDPYHNGGSGEDGGSPVIFDHADELDELDVNHTGSGDTSGVACARALLTLLLLQPKGLQEARLLYTENGRQSDLDNMQLATLSPEPEGAESPDAVNNNAFLQQQSQQLKNILMMARNTAGGLIGQRSDSPPCIVPPTGPQLNLMTPDAFSSPGKRDEDDVSTVISPDTAVDQRGSSRGLPSPPPVYELDEAPPKYTSGGSSPSREVQEILCLKEAETADNGDGYDYLGQQDMAAAKETIWPSITLAQINEANQRKASSDKSAGQSMNNSLIAADQSNAELSINEENRSDGIAADRMERVSLSSYDRTRLDAIELKLEKITEMMAEQSHLLRSLREERAPDPRDVIERALQSHTEQTTAAIDNALDTRWVRVERAASSAGAAAADAARTAVSAVLDPLTRTLHHELATRITATDDRLRDNIEKLVHSKSIQESVGNAVSRTLSGVVRDSLREVVTQTLGPLVERTMENIFQQITQAFHMGTKEFATNTEALARSSAERGSAAAVEGLRRELQRHADTLAALATQAAQTQQTPPVNQLTPVLHSAVRGVLEQEMSRWREQAASVLELSRSQTPNTPRATHTPHQDKYADRQRIRRAPNSQPKCYVPSGRGDEPQYNKKWKKVIVCDSNYMLLAQISTLLSTGDVNGAFQVALSASDLSLVVHACRAADPARVFSPSCQLKQNVLLSLVQQLAADMTHDTQLKHRYLEEAIINLDASNPVTREHMPAVVRELKRQLTAFLSANPHHQLARHVKMLLMATQSLLASAM